MHYDDKVLTKVEVSVCVCARDCDSAAQTRHWEMERIFRASYVHTCAHVYTYYESWPSPGSKMFMMSPENTVTLTHVKRTFSRDDALVVIFSRPPTLPE